MKRLTIAVWTCFLCVSAVAAQETLPNPFSTAVLKKNTDYLPVTQALRDKQNAYEKSPQWAGLFHELLSWHESYVDNHRDAISQDDARFVRPGKPEIDPATELQDCVALDARTAILKAAKNRQVVMINEAHHIPRHRAFTLSLLKGLYERGFRYFAAETLSELDSGLQKRGYPLFSTGPYLVDPVCGELVRTAISQGYRIIPYEELHPGSLNSAADPIAVASRRERVQAENLKSRILDKDPQAKVLVHVGYGHLSEKAMTLDYGGKSGEFKVMGLRFKELTGIDPLTIDQTLMYEHVREEVQNPLYRAASERGLLKGDSPVVFEKPRGRSWVPKKMLGTSDMVVFHPREQYRDGRATWLRLDGRRTPLKLPASLAAAAKPNSLVQAFYTAEMADNAVPADQFEVRQGEAKSLLLPNRGSFTLRVLAPDGTALAHEPLVRR